VAREGRSVKARSHLLPVLLAPGLLPAPLAP